MEGPMKKYVSDTSKNCEAFTHEILCALKEPNKNAVMSGYSLGNALSMAYIGASGGTSDEIQDILVLPKCKTSIKSYFFQIIKLLKSTKEFALENANGVFINDSFAVKEEFLNDMKSFYNADLKTFNLNTLSKSVKEINKWVEDKTNKKIKDMFNERNLQDSLLLLVNTIYLKGKWEKPFEASCTCDGDFFITPDKAIKVPMMNQSMVKLPYIKCAFLNSTILEMPYKGERFSMYIILPYENDGLEEVESKLKEGFSFEKLQDFSNNTFVDLTMPKFTVKCSYELKEPLINLGLEKMFNENADFSNICLYDTDKIYVSSIIQQAIIEVDEDGTEATAAAAVIGWESYCYVESHPVIVNHPFYFMIKDKTTGFVLFSGRVVDPSR